MNIMIVAIIGVGLGLLTFASFLGNHERDDVSTIAGIGATLLAAGVAALMAHAFGGFRDLEDDELLQNSRISARSKSTAKPAVDLIALTRTWCSWPSRAIGRSVLIACLSRVKNRRPPLGLALAVRRLNCRRV